MEGAPGVAHHMAEKNREYTTEEAASIITRVLDRATGEGGRISYDELLETAREIGVSTAELDQAVVEETKVRAERIVREEKRQRALRQLLRHAATFVVVGAFCFVLDTKLTGGVWYYWVLLGWGLALGLHAVRTLLPDEADKRLPASDKRVVLEGGKLTLKADKDP
jgi:hypothetical protein